MFVDASRGYTLCGVDLQSGTRDFFKEEVQGTIYADPSFSGFSNYEDILNCVANDANAIAFIPVAYVANRSEVKVLKIANYPLARPLYIVYDKLSVFNDEQAIHYLCCLLSPDGQAIFANVGYTTLSQAEIDNEVDMNSLVC
eukprot:TRINITY_DN25940_c0_g1_i1.p2 TRINITY_DN25940_c0_g1~~TRINITY_DN25940_c0_g1_i1.p2  ORF type:complete len:142 (-),score=12.37 TRINITY_DN25940_c0_g1_i1:105-530(-)